MVVFLYGPDDYRRAQRKKYWLEEFKKKHSGLSVGYFDLEKAGALEDLKAFVRGQSIFDAKKLAIIENLGEADEKTAAKELKPLVAHKETTLLFSERKQPNKALAFLLAPPTKTEEFANLDGYEWEKFAQKEAKRAGVMLSSEAMVFLLEAYKGNTWGLITELEKISSLGQRQVEKKDLEAAGLETTPNYWALVNGLKSERVATRLWALEKMFAQNEPPPKIFNILASQWYLKIPQMAEYDLKIKSGKLEYEEALVDLIL